jgi:hypothetical protein
MEGTVSIMTKPDQPTLPEPLSAADRIEATALAMARASIVPRAAVTDWVSCHAYWDHVDPAPTLQRLEEVYAGVPITKAPGEPMSDDERLEIGFARMQARGVSARFGFECCGLCYPAESRRRDVRDAQCWARCTFHAFDTLTLDRGYLDLQVRSPSWIEYDDFPDDVWQRAYDVVTGELTAVGLTWRFEEIGLPVRVTDLDWQRLPQPPGTGGDPW